MAFTPSSSALPAVGVDLRHLHGDLFAARGGVLGRLADLETEDRLPERAGLRVDLDVARVVGDLAAAQQESAGVARDRRGDDRTDLDDAVALGRLADGRVAQQLRQLAD